MACWIGRISADKGHFERAWLATVVAVPVHRHVDLGKTGRKGYTHIVLVYPSVRAERNYVQLYTITIPPAIAHFGEFFCLHPRFLRVFAVPP